MSQHKLHSQTERFLGTTPQPWSKTRGYSDTAKPFPGALHHVPFSPSPTFVFGENSATATKPASSASSSPEEISSSQSSEYHETASRPEPVFSSELPVQDPQMEPTRQPGCTSGRKPPPSGNSIHSGTFQISEIKVLRDALHRQDTLIRKLRMENDALRKQLLMKNSTPRTRSQDINLPPDSPASSAIPMESPSGFRPLDNTRNFAGGTIDSSTSTGTLRFGEKLGVINRTKPAGYYYSAAGSSSRSGLYYAEETTAFHHHPSYMDAIPRGGGTLAAYSPGKHFVAELSDVLELDVGHHTLLSEIMDRYLTAGARVSTFSYNTSPSINSNNKRQGKDGIE